MLSSRDDHCKCSCQHPSSMLCAAWQGHLAQVFLRMVGRIQHGGLPLDRQKTAIGENFSFPVVSQVQCCELLWITFAQERGCRLWTLMSCQWTLSYLLSRATCLGACSSSAGSAGECLVTGRTALRNWGGLLLYSIVFRCWHANWPSPSWWQPPHGSDSMPEFIKQQEGVKYARNAPLCPSEEATSKAVSLPLRAVPGLSLSQVKLPELAALWKAIILKPVHNTAASSFIQVRFQEECL